jgi:hypothetical protein
MESPRDLAEFLHPVLTAKKMASYRTNEVICMYLERHFPDYTIEALRVSVEKWLKCNYGQFTHYSVEDIEEKVVKRFISVLTSHYGLE